MRVLVTGTAGQVGAALLPELKDHEVTATTRHSLDLSRADAIVEAVRAARPQVILNPAAFTAVDRAESERTLAHAVNALAPGVLAEEARRLGALLVHYSTDYVFDGGLRRPYVEADPARPLSSYGRSKLEGEERVRASGCRHMVLRTSWVYGGPSGFPAAMLAKARKGDKLRMVSDQTGVPTWAADLARLTAGLVRQPVEGLWHASASGEVTRYDYVLALFELAGVRADVVPIATSEYPTPARRPAYSALDSRALERASGIPAIGPWRERLALHLKEAA